MFTLFKWLLWCCMPYSLLILGFVFFAFVALCRQRIVRCIGLMIVGTLLFVVALPWLSTTLGYSLEKQCPPVALQDIPKADAIVVLGGGIGSTKCGLPYPECYPASDRVIMAARLYHAGKAPIILPSGSSSAYAEKPLLETMRVPASAILCEDDSRDTAENAAFTFKLLRERGCKKVLLVTSAWHMPRALMLFQAEGIEIIPVGCDYEATLAHMEADVMPLWMKLPSPAALAQTGVYLKEYLGILFYSFRTPPRKD